jgi:hypothetical protein
MPPSYLVEVPPHKRLLVVQVEGGPVHPRLLRHLLSWLRADLALWGKEAKKATPEARAEVQKMLLHWQKDSGLAGVRDAVEKLPEAERADWKQMWGEVEALWKECSEGGKP